MSCSRCGRPVVTPEQFDRGLCAMCLTSASLSALVGLAASHQPAFMAPIYFGRHRSDVEWKASQFPQSTPEVM